MICMIHFYIYAMLYLIVVCWIFLFPVINFFCKQALQGEELALFSGEEPPVNFFSKKLKPAEIHYSATELECLAIIRAMEQFAVYLTGRFFTSQTDHRALQFLQQSRHLNGRLIRWALTLQQYMFDIQYWPGKNNGNADGLSRQAWSPEGRGVRLFKEGGDVRPQT